MILVIVKVHEPANPEAFTVEEDVITGIFHGFETEAQAMTWADEMRNKWESGQNVKFEISSSEHYNSINISRN